MSQKPKIGQPTEAMIRGAQEDAINKVLAVIAPGWSLTRIGVDEGEAKADFVGPEDVRLVGRTRIWGGRIPF